MGKPPKVLGQFHVTLPAFVPQVPHFPVLSRIIQVESCQINVKSTVLIACHSQSSSVPIFLGFTPFITILLPQFPHSFVLTRANIVTSLQLTIISPINTHIIHTYIHNIYIYRPFIYHISYNYPLNVFPQPINLRLLQSQVAILSTSRGVFK